MYKDVQQSAHRITTPYSMIGKQHKGCTTNMGDTEACPQLSVPKAGVLFMPHPMLQRGNSRLL